MKTTEQKIAIVTGANGGIGKNYTRMMIEDGFRVVMAVRNEKAAQLVKDELVQSHPQANIDILKVDMGDLSSIEAFSDVIKGTYSRIDVLAHNAGVYFFDNERRESADGIELNLAVHFVGPYALTMHLLPLLKGTIGSRVITMSSTEHHGAQVSLSDLQMKESFENKGNVVAYARSKWAALALSHAMKRQFENEGLGVSILAAHPGVSITGIQHKGNPTLMQRAAIWVFGKTLAASPSQAAKPMYMASTVGKSGEFYGPTGFKEMKGEAGIVQPDVATFNESTGQSLLSQVAELIDAKCNVAAEF
ncbi:SDR family NAD(P)-dependent oxidoreductase [Vibrio cyclitrophicus]